jgi:hypothetical protein
MPTEKNAAFLPCSRDLNWTSKGLIVVSKSLILTATDFTETSLHLLSTW